VRTWCGIVSATTCGSRGRDIVGEGIGGSVIRCFFFWLLVGRAASVGSTSESLLLGAAVGRRGPAFRQPGRCAGTRKNSPYFLLMAECDVAAGSQHKRNFGLLDK